MKKHIIILLIGLAVIVNAQVATPPSFGTGTESDPYQIATLENLYWITADTLNFHSHYIQTADINAAETRNWFIGDHDDNPETPGEPMGWKPIGNFSELYFAGIFDGTYDGQGHVIDSLYINNIPVSFEESMSGLFGWAKNAEIKNLGVTNSTITGGSDVGLIAGSFSGTLTNCFSSGNVSGGWAVGGLVGEGSGNIEKCYSIVNVTGYNYTGGMIGYFLGGTISQCYSSGNIILVGNSSLGIIGGFVGMNEGGVINCFSSSNSNGIYAAGFLGLNWGGVTNCFSYGKVTGDPCSGFMYGDDDYSCFWDVETSEVDSSFGGTGLTTVQMKTKQNYLDAGWDFVGESVNGTEDIWNIDGVHNNGYPYLRWMYEPVAIAPALGSGTSEDPYQIATLENLYWIAADTLNFHHHYIQTANIDASETRNWFIGDHDDDPETPDEPMGWKPIGNYSDSEFLGVFTGVYDGQGYTINNLYINILPKTQNKALTGLFGWAQNAELKNIGIINGTITGGSAVGLLAGSFYSGTVINCYCTGVVTGGWSLDGLPFFDIGAVGGLIGFGGGNIEKCWSNVNVIGYGCTGGLIGRSSIGVISQCYSNGDVTINGDAPEGYGGLVGYCEGDIDNCYTSSNVIGDAAAGFVGVQDGGIITNSFSYGELIGEYCIGFVGYGIVDDKCFWDTETSGCDSSAGGIGLTTAQMKSLSTFTDAGWDFVGETVNGTEDIWNMDGIRNNGYPFLAWMSTTGIEEDDILQPVEFTLSQNYPNPFNPVTTIKFSIPSDQNVKLSVYNSAGQLVENLINKNLSRGTHSVQFNAEKLNSGIYFYRLDTDGKSLTNKMLLIK